MYIEYFVQYSRSNLYVNNTLNSHTSVVGNNIRYHNNIHIKKIVNFKL